MRAVDVAPLQVVDRQDQRRLLRQSLQELAQPGKRATAQLLLVGHLRRLAGAPVGNRLDTLQHGKRPRQEGHVRRQQRLCLLAPAAASGTAPAQSIRLSSALYGTDSRS